jgi:nickel superoxide dismutase
MFLTSVKAQLLKLLTPDRIASAHCDIPCGIYDPHQAQLAAHSVIRMIDLIAAVERGDETKAEHDIARYVAVKEEHAEIVKREVRIIWGDYFKPEHLQEFPNLHGLVFDIMKLASKGRQTLDKAAAEELLAKVQEFAEIFFKTKGRDTQRIATVYPTGGEIVQAA